MPQEPDPDEKILALVLSQDRMGHGDDALGAILIKKFLKTFADIAPGPDFILLFNTGVKLALEDSEVLGELKTLERKGARILSCGTCLEYFGVKDKLRAGNVSTMHEIVGVMVKAHRTVGVG
jgi:selenium metabolism protein YedF